MTFTALVVELLIVGLGSACWLALFLAAIFKYKFDFTFFQTSPVLLIGPITAIVYVLGIVTDRISRKIFMRIVENRARNNVFTKERIKHVKQVAGHLDEHNLSMELEKFIRANSEPLGKKIDYNRSRLRICRA